MNKKEQIKSSKKTSVNKINNELDNNTNILFNNSNRINKEFLEIMGENQIFSRNKKQNTSKILSTKSQNEINLEIYALKLLKV